MEFWIRSQNQEELIRAEYIYVMGSYIRVISNGSSFIVGEYETKERALEILDEIQKEISFFIHNEKTLGYVYNLPDK